MIQVVASLTTNPDAPEAVQAYMETAMRLIDGAGARVTQRIEVGAPLIGDRPAKILLLVDYPSHAAIRQVFEDPGYKALIPTRQRAFLEYNICIVDQNEMLDSPAF